MRAFHSDPETWRAIPGYPEYEASNAGRIRRNGRVLKSSSTYQGYQVLRLYRNGLATQYKVHRLILLTFCGNPPTPDAQGNHINGLKSDNALANLEWVTPAENTAHAARSGLRHRQDGINNNAAKLTTDQIARVFSLRDERRSHEAIASIVGVSRPTISRLLSGKTYQGACQ